MIRIHSIRARMTLAFALSLCALMLFACLALTVYARRAAEHGAVVVLQNAANKVRHELSDTPRALDLNELHEVEGDIAAEHLSLVLLDRHARILEKAGNTAFDWPLRNANARTAWRAISLPSGAYTIVIGLPWTQTQRALDNQALVLLTLSLVTCGSATVGAWLLVGHTLSPIGRLSQQAQSAGVHAAGVRLTPPSQDAEVVELVTTLNDLLARQSEATAARGRFYAAASHELRTPLQALSGHLELALQRPRTGEEYLAVVQEANAQTQRLTTLVRDLLRLHQLEGASPSPQEPVDLEALCAHTLRQFTALIASRGLTLQTDIQSAVLLAAPAHAQILVRNLLENALQYATPNTVVQLRLFRIEGRILIEGREHGEDTQDVIGLELRNEHESAASLQPDRLFEAFYRPDSSRTARTGGNGLGLTICKAIADANGWQLTLTREDSWVVARVTFRAQPLSIR